MTMGQLGPPAWESGEIDPPAKVEKEVSGVGLSGQMIVG